ncbi:MAG: PorT family protein [Bacteroidaceae bacterium]|nr:PorT family protein [Bacteroidaceae bacterium]
MKKILLMVVAAIMVTMNMNAQEQGEFSYKTRFGGALSTFTNNSDAKSKLGLEWSFGADYMFTNNFGLSLEIHHEYLGAKYKETNKRVSVDYVGVPLQAKFYIVPWLAVQAGPQISFLLRGRYNGNKEHMGIKVRDGFKPVEFAVPVGLSFEPQIGSYGDRLLIDFRYRLGLSKANKEPYKNEDFRNSAFILTVGYLTDFFN